MPFNLGPRRAVHGAGRLCPSTVPCVQSRAPRSCEFRAYHDHWSRQLQILLSQLVAVFKIEQIYSCKLGVYTTRNVLGMADQARTIAPQPTGITG